MYLQKIEPLLVDIKVVYYTFHGTRQPVRERALVVLQLGDARPVGFVRGAQHPKYAIQLVDFGVPLKQGSFRDHFSEDTAYGPDIDGRGVLRRSQQYLGCSIPQRHDFVGVWTNWNRVGPCQTEVGNFDVI